ncbi:MAG: aconitate hydratase [Bacteroidota bacterium]|nr:aconitate hydratase [Bacteroidota bacterium]
MPYTATEKLIYAHLVEGTMTPGSEIGLRIDQTLTQDATGTLVMLEFERMGIPRVRTELSAQYVDHNLIQSDFKNPDDHLFLRSACRRFGVHFSRPGNGVSHPVHMERFGKPGKTLLGSDSHTCAAGSMGMLAIGAGGLDVATAMAGEPYVLPMPEIWGVRLSGELPDWVSAKDIILEMLRRHGVGGGVGRIIEYHGPGLAQLGAMDRHVIANMGAELGATTSVFPSDERTRDFLRSQKRGTDWEPLAADDGAEYAHHEEIDLSALEPLIAKPSSPGNVVPVREEAGKEIYQAMIGSSANPGMRDFAVPAMMLRGRHVPAHVSLDINPSSMQILQNLVREKYLGTLLAAGARIHQSGCNGCIGMGQAPATGKISLRTVPRNFPGRSGTKEDQVYLCSPETAAASALTGKITDPRTLDMEYPRFSLPSEPIVLQDSVEPPPREGGNSPLEKGPNIVSLPEFDELPDTLEGPVLITCGDDISTDEIMPAGARVLPFRSNIPEISRFTFAQLDESFYDRAKAVEGGVSMVVAGKNYGQGSSREHAALAPRYLGVRVVIAESYARIHFQNLANFGILPLRFAEAADRVRIRKDDVLRLTQLRSDLAPGSRLIIHNTSRDEDYTLTHDLSARQVDMIRAGSLMSLVRERRKEGTA